jgi:hypothetical protein
LADTIGAGRGFLVLIGDASLSLIVFGNNTSNFDSFFIDKASFASVAAAVPEPSTITGLVFLGSGLVLRRLAKRR